MYKYVAAIIITVGLIVFNFAKIGSKVDDIDLNLLGAVLLFISLFMDGLTATQSDIEKGRGKKSHAFHLMISNNLVGLIASHILIVWNLKEILPTFNLSTIYDLFVIGGSATLGQCFIYLTISKFDCFVLTTITTTRKFFSILFSIFIYSHPMTNLHWVGMTLVFGAIIWDMILSEMGRQKKKSKAT